MSLRTKTAVSVACAASVLALIPIAPAAGESIMVKRVFKPGSDTYVERTTEVVQAFKMPSGEMKITVKDIKVLQEKVKSVSDQIAKVVLTFDRISQTMESAMMGTHAFDSDDADNEEASPQLAPILGPAVSMSMTMEVDSEGKIKSFTGMDAINDKISEKIQGNMFWPMMKDEFTDEVALKEYGEGSLMMYANKQVSVGDTWTGSQSRDFPQLGTVVTDVTYKLERIGTEDGRKVAFISSNGKLSRQKNDSDGESPPELSGTVSGQSVYDVELGRVVKRSAEQSFEIKMKQAGQEANISISITFNSKVLSKKDRERQKYEAKKTAEMRKKAEEEEDKDSDDWEDDDDD